MTSPAPYCPAGITPSNDAVVVRVVLGLHREALFVAVERRSLGHRPGHEHAVAFEPEVVVQPRGGVLLDDEQERSGARRRNLRRGLGCGGERPFGGVFGEGVFRHARNSSDARSGQPSVGAERWTAIDAQKSRGGRGYAAARLTSRRPSDANRSSRTPRPIVDRANGLLSVREPASRHREQLFEPFVTEMAQRWRYVEGRNIVLDVRRSRRTRGATAGADIASFCMHR